MKDLALKSIQYIFILILLIFFSCSERENFTDDNGGGISGLFTEIGGSISGELNENESPYKILSDIIVDSGKTLTIYPDVELYFTENTKLVVYGELIILGALYHEVIMESYDTTKAWAGINIINSDRSALIDFAFINGIRKEYDSVLVPSSISVNNSQLTIKHSIIYKNLAADGGGVGVINGRLYLSNNVFRDNKADVFGGAVISETSEIKIINNTFYNNYSYNGIGGVLIYNPTISEIQNNIFYKNSSRTGQPHFYYQSEDSTNYLEQYNYFAFGQMDPIFLDEFYLTLYYTSPCKDAGNPDQIFYDYNGTRNDQGAYGGPEGNWE